MKHDQEINPQACGFTGLSNFTGICGTNAALQELKVALTIVIENSNEAEQAALRSKLYHLWKLTGL